MTNQGHVIRKWGGFAFHELALTGLGFGTAVTIFAVNRRFSPIFFEVCVALVIYASVIFSCRGRKGKMVERIRFLGSFAFTFWFYCAVARITPALKTPLRDEALLKIDETIFGRTPAVCCERMAVPWLTDLMSIFYMTYLVYLFVVVAHASVSPGASTENLGTRLFAGFAAGYAGYLLVPAIGPAYAYPHLFSAPLLGGLPMRINEQVVSNGSSRYDVFPSLHVLITCILLNYDWHHHRLRFWIMTGPCLGLLFSTVYLRYHYGADVLAAFVFFLVLWIALSRREQGRVSLPSGNAAEITSI
jgi:PAP2 superfamily